MSRMKLLLDVVQELRSLADSLQTLANAIVEHEYEDSTTSIKNEAPAAPPPTPAKKEIKLEQVRAVLAQKSHDGLTAEVRALLQKYGASKLSAIDPECYEALLMEAEELGHAS